MSIFDRLLHALGKDDAESVQEEIQLVREVSAEQERLRLRQVRAERVLRDFYRADAVIRGTAKGHRH